MFHLLSSLTLAAVLIMSAIFATAEKIANTGKNFNVVLEYHSPPNETQPKSTLEGAEAEFQSGGLILIHGLKLQTLATNGEALMILQAPHCVFDTAQHSLSSDGHLEAQSGDGKYFFEGEGFLFQQTNFNLIISNRVRTVIRSAPKPAPKQ